MTGGAAAERSVPDPLARTHPEWAGWLRLLDAADHESPQPAWRDAATQVPVAVPDQAPLLAHAVIPIERRALDGWTRRVLEIGAKAADAARPLAAAAAASILDCEGIFEAALVEDAARLDVAAAALGVPAPPLRAVAPILVMPLLRAIVRAAGTVAETRRGWCPVCGAWPALAEARGVERQRRLRCVRCGADWLFDWLRCPFCDTNAHDRLGGLGTETTLEVRRADTCLVCRGYVKTVAALTPATAGALAVLDLDTVDLDVAALAHGFRRPDGPGAALGARIVAHEARWRRWIG